MKSGIGGFGYHLSFNAAYMLGRKVGLGVNLSEIGALFQSDKMGSNSDDASAGIGRVSLTAGLRVHF